MAGVELLMAKWREIWKRKTRPAAGASASDLAALRQQIDALQASRRETEERLAKIFEHSNDAILLIDPMQDQILDANPKAGRMLGYSRQELLFIGISAIHPHQMPEMMAFAQSVLVQGHGWTDKLTCATKTGQFVPAEMSAAVANIQGRRCIVAAIRDVTGRKWAEDALRAIVEGTASTTGADFFRSLVRHLAAALQVRDALVAEHTDPATAQVRTLAFWTDGSFGENIVYTLRGTPGEKVAQGAICYYPESVPSLFPEQKGIQAYLAVPLYGSGGDVLGHLAVRHDQAMRHQAHGISILKVFAARAGAELERQRAEDMLAHRAQEMADLYEVSLEINAQSDLPTLLRVIVQRAAGLLGARQGEIYLSQPDGETLELAAVHNQNERPEVTLRLGQGLPGRVAQTGEPLMSSDDHSRQALGVPLKRGDQLIGVLSVLDDERGGFDEDEVQLLCLFANQAAVAIENARLRQRAEQAAVREERGRLSRELHDSVTQSLYSLTLLAEGWRRLAGAGRLPNVDEPLTELGEIAQQALKEMRLLVYELRPPELEKEGLLGALHRRLGAVEERAGVEARLMADKVVELPEPVEQMLYRIAQEALNNALKHAAATSVTVYLRTDDERVELEVVDDGRGFDPDATGAGGGIGLSSMRERVEKLAGTLTIHSKPGEGTRVMVSVKTPGKRRASRGTRQ
jgi:PAS domain S-box-containing protein